MKLFKRDKESTLPQLKWIWRFTKGERLRYVVFVIGYGILSAVFTLYALISRDLINAAIGGDRAGLVKNALILLTIVLCRSGAGLFLDWLGEDIFRIWSMRIRASLFESIMKKDEKAVGKYHSGILLDRIFADTGEVASKALGLFSGVFSMIVGLFVALVALFYMNPYIPAVIIACGVVFIYIRLLFRGKIKTHYLKERQANGECRAYYQEALENLLILRVFRAFKAACDRGRSFDKNSYGVWKESYRFHMMLSAGMSLFYSLGGLGAMTLCAFFMMSGQLSYGSLTAMLQLIGQVQGPFSNVFSQISAYTTMTASAQRLMELENLPETESQQTLDADKVYEGMDAIRVDNMSFAYEEGRRVFSDVTASIKKGDFVMMTGASGIGKSTLMKIMLSVYHPDTGEIYITMRDGERIGVDSAARSLFAYVPQGNLLFSGTIRDNLNFLCGSRTDAEIREALRLACADGFVDETPKGLDTVLEEGGRGLSDGQAQRLAIARALLSDAPILLLDEATSALDAETEKTLLENLRRLKKRTLILISHREAAMEICDREWHLDNGRLYERRIEK